MTFPFKEITLTPRDKLEVLMENKGFSKLVETFDLELI